MHALQDLAVEITQRIREHFPDTDLAAQQVLCLAEEAGEFVGAYRRWAGMARRSGPWSDVEAELADVVVTAYVTAEVLGIDLDRIMQAAGDPAPRQVTKPRQVILLADHAGRFANAYLRLDSSMWSDVPAELAGLVFTARATARMLGIDLDAAVQSKTELILSRGWRDRPAGEVSQ